MKFIKRKTGNIWGSKRNNEESVPRCFKCNSKKHLKADCPMLKKEARKGKEVGKGKNKDAGMIATWGQSDTE